MTGSKIREEQLGIKARDGSSIDTFLSMPAEGNARGGILVIQEIWGVTDFIRTVCRKLSEIGYMAMAPHLYSRADEKALFTEENIMDAMRPFWALPPEKRGDQKAVSEILEKLPEHTRKIVTKVMFEREKTEKRMISDLEDAQNHFLKNYRPAKTGVVGFCLGGGLAFQLSTQMKFDASIIFYGANPRNIDDLSRIKGSVLGIYAGEDSSINNGLPALVENVVKHKLDFEMKIYPGTYHAFFNHTGMSYNKPAADDAWKRMLAFFGSHLGE
ncbi:MAG: dienelactone hydrolase family protein [Candidatus Thermoplasmatota archaeon]|jgi:carboxymethylenebutenolidase|nr:dienelactone hydrolase family protein [Candidatus Thermoplasmatota archaeon]